MVLNLIHWKCYTAFSPYTRRSWNPYTSPPLKTFLCRISEDCAQNHIYYTIYEWVILYMVSNITTDKTFARSCKTWYSSVIHIDINFSALLIYVNILFVLNFMSMPCVFIGTFISWSCWHYGNILLIYFHILVKLTFIKDNNISHNIVCYYSRLSFNLFLFSFT